MGCLDGCHRNPVLELPITIGSYPIEDLYPFTIVVRATPDAASISSNSVITHQPSTTQLPDQEEYLAQQHPTTSNASQPSDGTSILNI